MTPRLAVGTQALANSDLDVVPLQTYFFIGNTTGASAGGMYGKPLRLQSYLRVCGTSERCQLLLAMSD